MSIKPCVKIILVGRDFRSSASILALNFLSKFMILVTGGAGFIGSNFVLDWLQASSEPVINLDKLTYAGNLENLVGARNNTNHIFAEFHRVADLISSHFQ